MTKTTSTTEKPKTAAKAEQPVEAKASKAAPKKTATAKPAPKKAEAPAAKAEQPIAVVSAEATPKQPDPEPLAPEQIQTVAATVEPAPAISTAELTITERVGLTAGDIWHYLSKNGATPVSKLVAALTEEEKIVQRSIGWLAQENKISIATVNRIETIALTE